MSARTLLLLSFIPLSTAFLWDLLGQMGLGGGMGGGGMGGGGMGGGYAPAPQPVYSPPPQPYNPPPPQPMYQPPPPPQPCQPPPQMMYHPAPPPQPNYPPPQPMYHPPPPQPKYYPPPQPKYHPPPPPPSYSAPQPTYSAPKPMTYNVQPPPPPSDGYMTGGYRRRYRTKRSENLIGVSSGLECNNSMLKKIMKKVMTEDEDESRANISAAIRGKDGQLAVFCTSSPFKFTISDNAEFCAVRNTKLACYAFTF